MSMEHYPALVRAPEPAQPLVFAFHGTGGDERQLFDLTTQLVPQAGVVSPRGDVTEQGAARFFRRTAEGVYDLGDLARATDKMVAFVEAHIALYQPLAVYAFGYSNGANILASVFLARPDLFDRVALLHPLVNWELPSSVDIEGKPVLITAGQQDPIAPWAQTEDLISWFADTGAELLTETHDGGHELRNIELTALQDLLTRS